MKKTIIFAVVWVISLVLLMVGAWYNSEDTKIQRNGFEVKEGEEPLDMSYHLNMTTVNLTSTSTLQLYAHNMGVNIIYKNTYFWNSTNGVQSFYFVKDNTIYFSRYDVVIYDDPYPIDKMWPIFVAIVLIGFINVVCFFVYFYWHPELQTSTQRKEVQSTEIK